MTGHDETQPDAATGRGCIVLVAGMASSGSGWLWNLTNDLLIAAGERDVRELRNQHELHAVLPTHNCSNNLRSKADIARLRALADDGHTFAVHGHKPPSRYLRGLERADVARAVYIYRDPRDVVVSVFQRGERARARGKTIGAFARFRTVDQVIFWVRWRLLRICDAWLKHDGAHIVRYEDLRTDTLGELMRLATFLEVTDVPIDTLREIVKANEGVPGTRKPGSHFRGGGRRRDALTPEQLAKCNRVFGKHLKRLGYSIDD